MPNRISVALLVTATLLVAACGSGSGALSFNNAPAGLTVRLTDAPVDDALEVVVVFTGIELQPAGGGAPIAVSFSTPKSINVLQLQNGTTTNLVEGANVPVGQYSWLRLLISADQNLQGGSYIRLKDGRQFALFIPSGSESGLKLVRGFSVAQGNITRLVVDFDLRKSIVAPPGQLPNWFLKPVLRVVDELQVGTLAGTVNLATLATALGTTESACKPGIYVYSGTGVTPDDMDGNNADGIDPLVYLPLIPAAGASTATYNVPFLEAGAYTVATTCNFDVDASPAVSEYDPTAQAPAPGATPPAGYQTMKFRSKNATVNSAVTTTVDFP